MTHKLVPIIKAMKRELNEKDTINDFSFDVGYNYAIEEVIAMLSTAPSGWMDIESVTKEVDEHGNPRAILVFDKDNEYITEAWWCDDDEWWVCIHGKVTPTHWMPLPPAPEVV